MIAVRASSAPLGAPWARATNTVEIVWKRGSRDGSEYAPSWPRSSTSSEVSSRASRTAAASSDSPYSTKPPGRAQPEGGFRLSMRTTPARPPSPISMMISTAGIGLRNLGRAIG
jgi:hypothetical protein